MSWSYSAKWSYLVRFLESNFTRVSAFHISNSIRWHLRTWWLLLRYDIWQLDKCPVFQWYSWLRISHRQCVHQRTHRHSTHSASSHSSLRYFFFRYSDLRLWRRVVPTRLFEFVRFVPVFGADVSIRHCRGGGMHGWWTLPLAAPVFNKHDRRSRALEKCFCVFSRPHMEMSGFLWSPAGPGPLPLPSYRLLLGVI